MSRLKVVMPLVAAVALFIAVQGPVSGQEDGDDGPQCYPFGFMNITTDRAETGFIQCYASSVNETDFRIEANNDSFTEFTQLYAGSNSKRYNSTPEFGSILRQNDPADPSVFINNFGIVSMTKTHAHVQGVKSDKGTTDAFSVYRLVDTSTEFVIAGWKRIPDRKFLAIIYVVAALEDTCLEIYKIFDGNKYVRLQSQLGGLGKYQIYRYYAGNAFDINLQELNEGEDVTGYYVNASKPVAVYFGHECAWVPSTAVPFCDYMVEQIPPVSQLGRIHVVPPIIGRSSAAGYIVRVVPAELGDTTITYLGKTVIKKLGDFEEFEQPDCSTATLVTCSRKCVVMQYNKGYLTVANDVPTDPFMQIVVPADRFTGGAGFATANFCLEKGVIIEFMNYVTIVTFENYKDNILFDGKPAVSANQIAGAKWTIIDAGAIKFAVTAFSISHDFHYVEFAPNTYGSFAVYVYGHSSVASSSSAYGYSVNYNITGTGVSSVWYKAVEKYGLTPGVPDAGKCDSEEQLTGAILKNNFGRFVPFPFTLRAAIQPAIPLTPVCKTAYSEDLLNLLKDFSKKINQWICKSQNCSFLAGEGVAIDYDTLRVDWIGTADAYTAIELYVRMIASVDIAAKNFAQCRVEIMNYMYYFINWPPLYTKDLISSRVKDGCPWPIPFAKPQFEGGAMQCPVID